MTLKLYGNELSGNSYKPRLLAALLGIALEFVPVKIFEGEHKKPELLALNPRGAVPFLVDDSKKLNLTDSAAILIYLAGGGAGDGSKHGLSSYWSADPVEQSLIADWLLFSSGHQSSLGKSRLAWSILIPSKGDNPGFQKMIEENHGPAVKALELLEQQLTGRQWLVAERATIADVACFPYAAWAPMANISLDKYPAVRAWIARVQNLPGYEDMKLKGVDDPLYLRRSKGL